MKKCSLYIICIVSMLCVFSCSNEDDVSTGADSGIMSFYASVGGALSSRSSVGNVPTTTKSINVDGSAFGVYCYYQDNETNVPDYTTTTHTDNPYMNNQKVECDVELIHHNVTTDTTITWNYSPEKVWPGAQKMIFYCYYPYTTATSTANDNGYYIKSSTTQAPTLHYKAPADITKQPDLMAQTLPGMTAGVLNVKFEHILSGIKFIIGDTCLTGITIKDIKVGKVNAEGDFVMPNTTMTSSSAMTWTNLATPTEYSVTGLDHVVTKQDRDTSCVLVNSFYLVPQELSGSNAVTVTIDYTDDYAQEQTRTSTFDVDWKGGQQYTYSVDIWRGLDVKLVSITNWTNYTDSVKTGDGNTGKHPYVAINGVKWSTMNLGATTVADSPETAYGDYYAWGQIDTYYSSVGTTASCAPVWKQTDLTTYKGMHTGYDWDNYYAAGFPESPVENNVLRLPFDAANYSWGGTWRIPTTTDYAKLTALTGTAIKATVNANTTLNANGIYRITASTTSPVTIDKVTYKVNGLLYVASTTDTSKRVFFPLAGDFHDIKVLTMPGEALAVWLADGSSDLTNSPKSRLYWDTSTTVVDSQGEYARSGFSIRPVSTE